MVLMLVLSTALGYSQDFLGIKVDGNRQDCINKFLAKGFKTSIAPSNTVTSLKGMVGNDKVELMIVSTPITKKVWKFSVFLPERTTWSSLKSNYEYYVDLLTTKYGEPTSTYSNFISPYYEGDGYEMTGVKIEKCNYMTFWDNVYIEISKWGQVCIHYENTTNSSLNKEEKDKINLKNF